MAAFERTAIGQTYGERAGYERAKDRNRGREPDELYLAYEREMTRLRVIESALLNLVTLKDGPGPRNQAHKEAETAAWSSARAALKLT